MDDTVVSAFAAALGGRDAVATDAATLAENAKDYWGFGQQPGLVLRPHTRDEVVAIVKVAAEHNIALVTRGGASNCSAGVMAGSDRVVIDLTKMNQVLDIDPAARTARVQPGVINSDLQQQLAPHGLVFSPDPVSAHLATVGGNITENAGGPHALKYGVTYNHVLNVEAVLADGTVIELSAADDGPDLLGVLIGSGRHAGDPHRGQRGAATHRAGYPQPDGQLRHRPGSGPNHLRDHPDRDGSRGGGMARPRRHRRP